MFYIKNFKIFSVKFEQLDLMRLIAVLFLFKFVDASSENYVWFATKGRKSIIASASYEQFEHISEKSRQ